MDFEGILEQIGNDGRYQKRLLFLVLIPLSLVGPFTVESLLFMLSEPDHWCAVPQVANLSWPDQHLLVRPRIKGSSKADSCHYRDMDYGKQVTLLLDYKKIHNTSAEFMTPNSSNNKTKACSSWTFDNSSYEATAITEYKLICNESHMKGALLMMTGMGGMVGSLFFGYCAGRFGRKHMLPLALTLTYVMLVLPIFLRQRWIFIACRIVLSFSMTGVLDLTFLILEELVKPERRSSLIGVHTTFWTLGMCLLPLTAFLIRNWIGMMIMVAVVTLPTFSYIWMLPESPRWLVSKGRYTDAYRVLSYIARVNDEDVPTDLMDQLKAINTVRKLSNRRISIVSVRIAAVEEDASSPFEIFKHAKIRKHFAILVTAWIACMATYEGLTLNFENFEGNEFMNWFLLSLVEFPSNLLGWYLVESVLGRRWTTSSSLVFGGLALCAPAFMTSATMILVSSLVGKFLTNQAYNSMFQQTMELFPTPVRSQAVSYSISSATAVNLGLPFVIALGKHQVWIPLMVIGLASVIGGITTAFLPETLDQNLPQTIEDGERLGKGSRFFSLATRKNMQHDRRFSQPRKSITISSFG